MKRTVSLLIVIALFFSLIVPVYADTTTTVITLNKNGLAVGTYEDTYDNTSDSSAVIKTYNKDSFRGITYIVTIDDANTAVQFKQSIGLVGRTIHIC